MEYIKTGTAVNTHGLKGELKIKSCSDFDEIRYRRDNTVYLLSGGEYVPFRVATFRMHKNDPLVSFRGYQDINLIEKYKGCDVFIAAADRHKLPEGEYYEDELIGLRAFDQEGNDVGEVISAEETRGAQKNLRIRMDDGREFLLPDIPQFVLKVDISEGKMTVRMDEGLL